MRVIMLMYDTLCRHMLSTYGCDWVRTPNFERLAERSVQFNNSYAGKPAVHARPAGAAYRKAEFPAPKLGTDGAVRRFHAGDPEEERDLESPDQ